MKIEYFKRVEFEKKDYKKKFGVVKVVYDPEKVKVTELEDAKGYDLTSEYAGMSETELDKEFAMARYIATPEEINRYIQLKGEDAIVIAGFTTNDKKPEKSRKEMEH